MLCNQVIYRVHMGTAEISQKLAYKSLRHICNIARCINFNKRSLSLFGMPVQITLKVHIKGQIIIKKKRMTEFSIILK